MKSLALSCFVGKYLELLWGTMSDHSKVWKRTHITSLRDRTDSPWTASMCVGVVFILLSNTVFQWAGN